jgi:hypothetical protein
VCIYMKSEEKWFILFCATVLYVSVSFMLCNVSVVCVF